MRNAASDVVRRAAAARRSRVRATRAAVSVRADEPGRGRPRALRERARRTPSRSRSPRRACGPRTPRAARARARACGRSSGTGARPVSRSSSATARGLRPRRTGPRAARAPPVSRRGPGRDRVSSCSSSSRSSVRRVLRHLGEPGAEVAIGERREQLDVGEHRHAAGRTCRRGSCPRGGSRRSCRRSPRRPAPVSVVGTCTNGSPRM